MKKVLSILLSVAMIVLCFAACGKTDGDKSSTGKAANVKVGFIFLLQFFPWRIYFYI